MKPAILLTTVLMALAAPLASANGGGYASTHENSELVPFDMEDIGSIAMDTEDLRVVVGAREARIHVLYTMRNTTDKRVKCRFGFPVDYYHSEKMPYEAKAGGKVLKHTPKAGGKVRGQKILWMVSELTVEPHEVFPLEISLVAPLEISHGQEFTYKSDYVGFLYRFSSAAVWNGPIRKGHVEFIPEGIDPEHFKILSPDKQYTRRKSDGAWVRDFENFEPAEADDVKLQVLPSIEQYDVGDRYVAKCDDGTEFEHIHPGQYTTTTLKAQPFGYLVQFPRKTRVGLLFIDKTQEAYDVKPLSVRVNINGEWYKDFQLSDLDECGLRLDGAPKAEWLQVTLLQSEKPCQRCPFTISSLFKR